MLSPVDELFALDARLRQLAAHRQKAAHADDIPTAEALEAQHREYDEDRQRLRARLSDQDEIQYEKAQTRDLK
jgi:hypothetical protein